MKPFCSPCCLPRTAIRPSATRLPSCRNAIPRPPRIRPSGAGTPRISGPFVCRTGCWVLLMPSPSACRVYGRDPSWPPSHPLLSHRAVSLRRTAIPMNTGFLRMMLTSSRFLRPAGSRIRSKGDHFFDLVLPRCPRSSFLLVRVLRRHLNAPLIPLLTPIIRRLPDHAVAQYRKDPKPWGSARHESARITKHSTLKKRQRRFRNNILIQLLTVGVNHVQVVIQ